MVTVKELRERDQAQVENELGDRIKHLFELRSQAVTEKLEDPSQLRKTRKEIARIQTVLSERRNKAIAEKAKTIVKAKAPKIEAPAKPEKAPKAAKAAKAEKSAEPKKAKKQKKEPSKA